MALILMYQKCDSMKCKVMYFQIIENITRSLAVRKSCFQQMKKHLMCYSDIYGKFSITSMVTAELYRVQIFLFCLMPAYLGISTSKIISFLAMSLRTHIVYFLSIILFGSVAAFSQSSLGIHCIQVYTAQCIHYVAQHRTMFTCISLCLYRRYIKMYVCEILNHFHSGLAFIFNKQMLFCYFTFILLLCQCHCLVSLLPLIFRFLAKYSILVGSLPLQVSKLW